MRQQRNAFMTTGNRTTVGHGDKYQCRARGVNIGMVSGRRASPDSGSLTYSRKDDVLVYLATHSLRC